MKLNSFSVIKKIDERKNERKKSIQKNQEGLKGD
jgi:hypothetical protein